MIVKINHRSSKKSKQCHECYVPVFKLQSLFTANFPRRIPKFNVSRKSFEWIKSVSTKIKQILYLYKGLTFLVLNVHVCYFCKYHTANGLLIVMKNKSGKWLATLCNCVFHFYLQIKIFHQNIIDTKFRFSWKKDFVFKYIFSLFFDCGVSLIVLIVIAHGEKLSA